MTILPSPDFVPFAASAGLLRWMRVVLVRGQGNVTGKAGARTQDCVRSAVCPVREFQSVGEPHNLVAPPRATPSRADTAALIKALQRIAVDPPDHVAADLERRRQHAVLDVEAPTCEDEAAHPLNRRKPSIDPLDGRTHRIVK